MSRVVHRLSFPVPIAAQRRSVHRSQVQIFVLRASSLSSLEARQDGTSSRSHKLVSDLPRRQASLFMQLRTVHAPLNKHLHCVRSADSSICSACENSEETMHHIVMNCPAYRTQRDALRRLIPNRAYHIRQLMSSDKHISDLFTYIAATRRLERASGNAAAVDTGSEPTRSPRTFNYSHLRKPCVPAHTPHTR